MENVLVMEPDAGLSQGRRLEAGGSAGRVVCLQALGEVVNQGGEGRRALDGKFSQRL